jgi:hypothetical protein
MSVEDVMLALEFLRRCVPRGHVEEDALVGVIERLEKAAGLVPAV